MRHWINTYHPCGTSFWVSVVTLLMKVTCAITQTDCICSAYVFTRLKLLLLSHRNTIFIHTFCVVFDAPGADTEMSPPYLDCHRPKGPSVWATSDSHKAPGDHIYNNRLTWFTDIGHQCFLKLPHTLKWKYHHVVCPWLHQGLYSLRRRRLTGIGIPIINLRRSDDRLRFIMGIPILNRQRLLCE